MSSLAKGQTSSLQLNSCTLSTVWCTLWLTAWHRPRARIPYLWLESRKAAWEASLLLNVTVPSPSRPESHGGFLHLLHYRSPHPTPPALTEQLRFCLYVAISLFPPLPSYLLSSPSRLLLFINPSHWTHNSTSLHQMQMLYAGMHKFSLCIKCSLLNRDRTTWWGLFTAACRLFHIATAPFFPQGGRSSSESNCSILSTQ